MAVAFDTGSSIVEVELEEAQVLRTKLIWLTTQKEPWAARSRDALAELEPAMLEQGTVRFEPHEVLAAIEAIDDLIRERRLIGGLRALRDALRKPG